VKANSAIDDEIRRIEQNAKKIVSGDIESIVKDKKREEAAKDEKDRAANAKQEESVKQNRHRLVGMLTETDQLIAKRESETGVTTAQHLMETSGDKILQKLRESRTKIYAQIVKINEEYPEIAFGEPEAAGAAPVAEKVEHVQTAEKPKPAVVEKSEEDIKDEDEKKPEAAHKPTGLVAAEETSPEEKAANLLKERIRAFEKPESTDQQLEQSIIQKKKSVVPESFAALGRAINLATGVDDNQLSYLDRFKA